MPLIHLNKKKKLYLKTRFAFEWLTSLVALILLTPFLIFLIFIIKLDSRGPALFIQQRAGKNHIPFKIYKFRTMRFDAPNLSTEDMQISGLRVVTRIGSYLRRTSIDEVPQLLNVIKGEMSFFGPRPALLSQHDVLELRQKNGVSQLLPGITGYAQATGRDSLTNEEKVSRDAYYLRNIGPEIDLKIIYLTMKSVIKGTGNK